MSNTTTEDPQRLRNQAAVLEADNFAASNGNLRKAMRLWRRASEIEQQQANTPHNAAE